MEISVNGLKAFAATGGRALNANEPAVIFVHGAGLDRTIWQLQTRNIAFMGRRVYALDLPAHGRSDGQPLATITDMADWVVAFMDAAGIDKAKLIGHSMGAFVSLETAAKHPDRVEKLCLMGVAETMPVHPDLLAAAKDNQNLAPQLIVCWGLGEAAKIGGHPHPGYWLKNSCQTLLERAKNGVLFNDLTACDHFKGALDAATRVDCETLFVLGKDDMMTPVKKARPLADAVQTSTTAMIEDCGHMLMNERPHQVFEALKRFV